MHTEGDVRNYSIPILKCEAIAYLVNRTMAFDFFDSDNQIYFDSLLYLKRLRITGRG